MAYSVTPAMFWTMKKFNPYSLIRSFGFALYGIYYALTRERNLRIHFTAGAFAIFISRYYDLSRAELCILIMSIGFVWVCELINTSIENTVDLETAEYHRLAKIAKDVAAGAVLVSAITSVIIGLMLFWDVPILKQIAYDIMSHPFISVIILIAAFVWIFIPQKENQRRI